MTSLSQEVVENAVRTISGVHMATVNDEHARAADHAAANLCSGGGLPVASAELLQLINESIQIGYAAALRDVRGGNFDDHIRQWRPDMFSE